MERGLPIVDAQETGDKIGRHAHLAPLAVYCLWKKCRGRSVLDTENKPDKATHQTMYQALDKHLAMVVEPEHDTRKADQI